MKMYERAELHRMERWKKMEKEERDGEVAFTAQ